MAHSSYRILVVDDIEDNVFMLSTILEAEGYEVEVAYSGRSALRKVEASIPDLVLLDIMMPDLNGYEVVSQMRKDLGLVDIPVLLVTAYVEPEAEEGINAGANDFIRKPLNFDDLLERIGSFLQSKEGNWRRS